MSARALKRYPVSPQQAVSSALPNMTWQPRQLARPQGTPQVAPQPRRSLRSQQRKQAKPFQLYFQLFLAGLLLVGILQSVRALGASLYELSVLVRYQPQTHATYNNLLAEHKQYRQQMRRYNSYLGAEELVRNHLNNVGPGEILVRFQ